MSMLYTVYWWWTVLRFFLLVCVYLPVGEFGATESANSSSGCDLHVLRFQWCEQVSCGQWRVCGVPRTAAWHKTWHCCQLWGTHWTHHSRTRPQGLWGAGEERVKREEGGMGEEGGRGGKRWRGREEKGKEVTRGRGNHTTFHIFCRWIFHIYLSRLPLIGPSNYGHRNFSMNNSLRLVPPTTPALASHSRYTNHTQSPRCIVIFVDQDWCSIMLVWEQLWVCVRCAVESSSPSCVCQCWWWGQDGLMEH